MAGYIPSLPTETSGAPELGRWQGVRTEPSLSERIDGHVPYPGPPPAYDVENYARYAQWLLNQYMAASALAAERKSSTVTLGGATVGNQRRIVVNGTNIDYSDVSGDTLASVTQKFADLINDNATVTAGANAAQAVYVTAGTLRVFSVATGTAPTLIVTASVLAGAGTISAGAVGQPHIVIPASVLGTAANCIVLGSSPDDAGADNDTRFVLDRVNVALRIGTVNSTQWDTRATNSIGIGSTALPQAADAIAIGRTSTATAADDIAFGRGATANGGGSGALCIGLSATASAATATAIGVSATASAAGAVCVGASTASAAQAVAVGTGCTASAQGAIAIGNNTEASAIGALATGRNGTGVLDPTVKATARGARAHGAPSGTLVSGRENVLAAGIEADAIGAGCQATGDYSRASGYGAVAANRGEQAAASLGIAPGVGGFPEQCVHQAGRIIAQARTVGLTTRRCLTDTTSGTTGLTWTPRDFRGYYARIRVVAKRDGAAECEVWTAEGAVAVDAGVAVIGSGLTFASVDNIGAPGLTAPTVAASGAGIYVDVPGNAAETWLWTCEIQYVQAGATY